MARFRWEAALVLAAAIAGCGGPTSSVAATGLPRPQPTTSPSTPLVLVASSPEPTLISPWPSTGPSPSLESAPATAASASVPATPSPPSDLDASAVAALLPTSINGRDYRVSSGAIRVEEIGDSDNCYIICAHEYVGFASRLGIKQGQLILATSFPQDRAATSGVWIYAIRLEGADPRRLVDAWVTRISSGLALRESTISAKRVVVDDEYGTAAAYIYAKSGVLFLVFGPVLPDGSTSADVRAALALLP